MGDLASCVSKQPWSCALNKWMCFFSNVSLFWTSGCAFWTNVSHFCARGCVVLRMFRVFAKIWFVFCNSFAISNNWVCFFSTISHFLTNWFGFVTTVSYFFETWVCFFYKSFKELTRFHIDKATLTTNLKLQTQNVRNTRWIWSNSICHEFRKFC